MLYGSHEFPAASCDAWKLRSPDEERDEPPPCSTCGCTWEGDGPGWDIEWVTGIEAEDRIVVPFGWCPECGWRCEACPDIEDAYERTDIEFITEIEP